MDGKQMANHLKAFQLLCASVVISVVALATMCPLQSEKLSSFKLLSINQTPQKPWSDVESKGPEIIKMPGSQKFVKLVPTGLSKNPSKFLGHTNFSFERSLMGLDVPYTLKVGATTNIGKLSLTQKRKAKFIKVMLPLIHGVNEIIIKERSRITSLRALLAVGQELTAEDEAWLAITADRYGLANIEFNQLLKRVDIVPPSLAIAQAAEESGWGTSRFVREGNALFGQRVYSPRRKGIVPKERPIGTNFRVRAFDNLIDSVKAYVHNLNSHFAYNDFRERRAALRADFGQVNGYELAGSLLRYSERGEDYINTIRSIMRFNALQIFDAA